MFMKFEWGIQDIKVIYAECEPNVWVNMNGNGHNRRDVCTLEPL